jgi:uncharacterized membrane protein YfcA
LDFIIFFALGVVVAFINGIAGGASVISLPIMIILGLPPTIANGTNRFGILVGTLSSIISMRHYGYLRMDIAKSLLLPTIIGAIIGTFFAIAVGDSRFQGMLTIAIVIVAIVSFFDEDLFGKPSETPPVKPCVKSFLGFMAISLHGGFLQVGVGFVQIFALRKYTGLDLKQVNAIKNFLAIWFLLISSIGLFWAGKVVFEFAICMALGGILGGYLGSKFQHIHDQIWIRRIIRLASAGLAGKLIYDLLL